MDDLTGDELANLDVQHRKFSGERSKKHGQQVGSQGGNDPDSDFAADFAFHFAHGSREAVIGELAKFQNNDGGFASCLESDTRWCGSSPLGAMKALRILTEVGAPTNDPQINRLDL